MPQKKKGLKRPSVAIVGHIDPPEPPEWVGKQLAAVREVEQVDWVTHMARLLTDELRAFSKLRGGQVTINLRCDFVGMGTEAFAAQRIKESLTSSGLVGNFTFRVDLACDNASHSRDSIEVNHSPAHMACDIDERDFGTGTLCTTAGDTLQMPRGGVDIYVACFPCGPFSPRGKIRVGRQKRYVLHKSRRIYRPPTAGVLHHGKLVHTHTTKSSRKRFQQYRHHHRILEEKIAEL